MSDILDKIKESVKDREGIWGKIQNFFTLGYGSKEDLRETDKALRDNYYTSFKEVRYRWIEINLGALEAGMKGDDFKKVLQVLDRVMEKVHHADYGYAGLFDRKGHVREDSLAKSLDFDKKFGADLAEFETAVGEIFADYEAEEWQAVMAKTKKLRSKAVALDTKWNERESIFRPVGV